MYHIKVIVIAISFLLVSEASPPRRLNAEFFHVCTYICNSKRTQGPTHSNVYVILNMHYNVRNMKY